MIAPRVRGGCTRRGAFTLIELLVVIAIIALLISILLPSLSESREQGRIAKCLANLQTLMRSTQAYFNESGDLFPFFGKTSSICSWGYGGKTSSDYWKTKYSGAFHFRATERALNYTVYSGPIQPDLMQGDQIVRRTELPVYQCPSDRQSNQRRFLGSQDKPPEPISCYDDVGTSYHFALTAITQTTLHAKGWGWKRTLEEVQRRLVQDAQNNFAGEFVLLWEDPMDWALYDGVQEMGNHGKFSKHAAGFLDGHAAYKYMDTRSHGGPGWYAINPNWVKKPDNDPAFYYQPVDGGWSRKNVEPPK